MSKLIAVLLSLSFATTACAGKSNGTMPPPDDVQRNPSSQEGGQRAEPLGIYLKQIYNPYDGSTFEINEAGESYNKTQDKLSPLGHGIVMVNGSYKDLSKEKCIEQNLVLDKGGPFYMNYNAGIAPDSDFSTITPFKNSEDPKVVNDLQRLLRRISSPGVSYVSNRTRKEVGVIYYEDNRPNFVGKILNRKCETPYITQYSDDYMQAPQYISRILFGSDMLDTYVVKFRSDADREKFKEHFGQEAFVAVFRSDDVDAKAVGEYLQKVGAYIYVDGYMVGMDQAEVRKELKNLNCSTANIEPCRKIEKTLYDLFRKQVMTSFDKNNIGNFQALSWNARLTPWQKR